MKHKRQFQRHAAEIARRGVPQDEPVRPMMSDSGLLIMAPGQPEESYAVGDTAQIEPVVSLEDFHPLDTASPTESVDTGVDTIAPVDPAPVLSLAFQNSNIRAASLDPATGICTVEFKSGKSYRYGGFTAELMAAWRDAPSAGSWFNAYVKNRTDIHPLIADLPSRPAGA